jgi:hypothetical protein
VGFRIVLAETDTLPNWNFECILSGHARIMAPDPLLVELYSNG